MTRQRGEMVAKVVSQPVSPAAYATQRGRYAAMREVNARVALAIQDSGYHPSTMVLIEKWRERKAGWVFEVTVRLPSWDHTARPERHRAGSTGVQPR